MHCTHDCLVTSCIILAIFVGLQISVLTVTYTNFNDEQLSDNTEQKQYSNTLSNHSFPSALIIGVRKGGTRALLDALALHPLIRIVRRETHFFDLNYEKGLQWYEQFMPKTNEQQIVIEKTPGYFTNKQTPWRVKLLNPDMKIILIVRDPVQRIVSDFTQVYYNKLEMNKCLPIFEKEVFLPGTKDLNPEYKPVRNSLYHVHLSNWLEHFPLEKILLVNGDVFKGNPLKELRRVESFLGLPAAISPNQLIFNEKKGFFCFLRNKSTSMKCLGNSKGRPHRNISTETLEIVHDRLAKHNQLFFSLVNRVYNW